MIHSVQFLSFPGAAREELEACDFVPGGLAGLFTCCPRAARGKATEGTSFYHDTLANVLLANAHIKPKSNWESEILKGMGM